MHLRDAEPHWHPLLWMSIVGVLALPAAAMRWTDAVRWGPEDFMAATGLLVSAALGIELILRMKAGRQVRWLSIGTVLGVLLLVWAELAVGLFD